MIAARRTRWNFALQRAVERCVELGKPLVILEPLDVDYPWASDRLHHFVLDGMTATAAVCAQVARVLLPLRRARARTWPRLAPATLAARLHRHHRPLPGLLHPAAALGGRQGQRRARRGRRFEWPDTTRHARPPVHVGAIVSRVRPTRASVAPARISRGTPAQEAAATSGEGRPEDPAAMAVCGQAARAAVGARATANRSLRASRRHDRWRARGTQASRELPEVAAAALRRRTQRSRRGLHEPPLARTCTSATSRHTRSFPR